MFARIVIVCLLTAFSAMDVAFAQTPSVQGSKDSTSAPRYLILPNGYSVPVREDEDPRVVWEWAKRTYPEVFAGYEEAFGNFPLGTLYDADYFNSCVLKDLSKAKTELAVRQLHQVCTHMATPKRCRSAATNVEKAQCVKTCQEAGYFSNTFGDCSKG